MRATPLLLTLLMAVSCLHAQQQEEHLLNRLLNSRDKKFANPLGEKSFQGTPDLMVRGAADQKQAYGDKKNFATETFSTRSFLGIKNPWFGNKVFNTKTDEDWSKKALNDAGKKYKVEKAQVQEYYQAGKSAEMKDTSLEVRNAPVKGAAQGSLDETKKNLSIDDVRQILNKNR